MAITTIVNVRPAARPEVTPVLSSISVVPSIAVSPSISVSPSGLVEVNVTRSDVQVSPSGIGRAIVEATVTPSVTVSVNFGGSGSSSSGSIFTSGSGAPSGGNSGDWYLRTTTLALYENISGTWTLMGYIASSVTNTEARFNCPDGTERGTIITP